MTRAIIFGALIAITLLSSVLVTSMMIPTAEARNEIGCDEGDDYKTLESASATQQGKKALKLSVDTCGEIPRFADDFIKDQLVFGYAWLVTTEFGNDDQGNGELSAVPPKGESGFIGVLATIHPTIGRDSNQNPDAWHTHPVELTKVRAEDSNGDLNAGTVGAITSAIDLLRPVPPRVVLCITDLGTSQGGISLHDDVMRLNIAENQAGINANQVDIVASFVVVKDKACKSTLSVIVLSSVVLEDEKQ